MSYYIKLCLHFQTESSDYSLSEAQLTFQVGSSSTTTVCGTLDIVPDGLEEEDEEVVVHVLPTSPDVTVGGVELSITVTILNDDGILYESNTDS